MSTIAIPGDGSPFDQIRRTDPDGTEYWTGRDLQPLMEYAAWRDFTEVIEKAKASLAIVQGPAAAGHHLCKSTSDGGRWGTQSIGDYRLTRFGAYLVAMAGDDTKPAVAAARVYFAVRTQQAEAVQQRELTRMEILTIAVEAEKQRLVERERANRAESRVLELTPAAHNWEVIQGGDGITLRTFHKKYFAVNERAFFEHLYSRGYLIDQRGKGGWSEKRQKHRDGSQHRHPTAKGKAWLYLHASVDRSESRREGPRVKPGDPETDLKQRLIREGLPPHRNAIELAGGAQ